MLCHNGKTDAKSAALGTSQRKKLIVKISGKNMETTLYMYFFFCLFISVHVEEEN